MVRIKWLKSAQIDLKDVYDYISKDSARYAKLQIERIINKTQIIHQFLTAGKEVPEFQNPNLRELIEGNFRIIYKIISSEEVHILLIHHTSRDLTKRTL